MSIIREYPAAAALCVAADALVTIRFTRLSAASDPTAMTYFIALYGAFMGVLIFSAGLARASAKAEEKLHRSAENAAETPFTPCVKESSTTSEQTPDIHIS